MGKFLYDEDSVGYALAFQNYNITLHQPHPPGYIFFVGLGKSVNFFINNPNNAIIIINIFFTILTVLLIYFLGKEMFSRKFGFIASLSLIFNPIFWLYGEIAASYMSGALFASLIAFTSYRALEGDNRFIYISAVSIGLAGGFRSDTIFLMFPLWLYCVTYKMRELKKIIKALLVVIVSALLWFIPTLILAGGYESYSVAANRLFIISFSTNSVIFGADMMRNIMMDLRVLYWSVLGIGIVNTLILLIYVLYKLKSIKISHLKNSKVILIVMWIVPTIIFDLLILFAKPGYILVFLPALALIMAYVIVVFSSDLHKRFTNISSDTFLSIFVFIILLSGAIQFAYPSENGIYQMRIHTVDKHFQNLYDSVGAFSPQNTVLFLDNDIDCRKINYYFPDHETYCYVSYTYKKDFHELIHYKNGKTHIYSSSVFEISLNSSTTKILWLIDTNSELYKELETKIELKTLKLPNGQIVYYSDLSNNNNFQIANIKFTKE